MCFYDVAVVKSSLQVPLLTFLEASFLRHSSVFILMAHCETLQLLIVEFFLCSVFYTLHCVLAELQHTPGFHIFFSFCVLPLVIESCQGFLCTCCFILKFSPSTLNVNQCFAYSNCTVNSTWGFLVAGYSKLRYLSVNAMCTRLRPSLLSPSFYFYNTMIAVL